MKIVKNAYDRTQVDIFTLIVLSNQQSKTQRYYIYNKQRKKTANAQIWDEWIWNLESMNIWHLFSINDLMITDKYS